MNALVLVALMAVVLMLIGGMLGAELQDKLHEGQRRRMARRQEIVNERWRALEDDDGYPYGIPWHTRRLIPVHAHAELDDD
jgi:hypothetical protein